MKLYESLDGERSMLTIAAGEIYLFVRAESDNGQTSQQVSVCLDVGQAMQLREQLNNFIEGK